MLIHIFDIGTTEVATVKNKTDVFVVIVQRSINHVLKLAHIVDGTGIHLVEQRFFIALIKSQWHVEDRQPIFIFGFTKFNDVNIAGLTVFIGWVVGDVETILLILIAVPFG